MSQEKLTPKEGTYLEKRENPLHGKVVLITGSSRDVGAGIAIALGKEGINIVGNHRDPQKAKREQEVTEALLQTGVKSKFVIADITKEEDRKRLFEIIKNSFGNKLDFLVLNASGPSTEINVDAANALVDKAIEIMPSGGKIILMQSVPGHYAKQLEDLGVIPSFYQPIARAKYQGEQSLRTRINQLKEKGISFIVVCPPEVTDTSNMKVFTRLDPTTPEKHSRISDMLGIPKSVTVEEVGKKVVELLKLNPPIGYVELFGKVLDARNILSQWYGDNAIFVDTLELIDQTKGIGRMIVAKEYAKGHFRPEVGISVLPGHVIVEAAAQTLGLIALNGQLNQDSAPLFQGIDGPINFLGPAFPGNFLKIQGAITESSKRGFVGNVVVLNQEGKAIATINGIKATILPMALAKRLLKD